MSYTIYMRAYMSMNGKFFYAMAQSDEPDPEEAAAEVVKRCREQLDGRKPRAGIIYMGIAVDHRRVLDAVCACFRDIKLIGCTTDGEFSSGAGYMQDSVLLVLFCSDDVEFIQGRIDLNKDDAETVKSDIKQSLEGKCGKPRLGIMFSDGITLNSENALEIMNNVFDGKVPFFGGAAADMWRFTGTRQFFNNTVFESTAVYMLFCGEFDYSFAVGTGWTPVGSYGIVNRSHRNNIKEINNMRAIDFYKDILGQNAAPSIEMPMAVYNENDSFMFLRTTLSNTVKDDGSIVFLGDIPENFKVRVTLVDRTSILDGTSAAVDEAMMNFPEGKRPSIAICFSCTARRAVLGMRTGEECGIVRSKLGDDALVAGFYTYGEFSPPGKSLESIFHNETFVCLLLE